MKRMIVLMLALTICVQVMAQTQPQPRKLLQVVYWESGYDLGYQHGQQLKLQIDGIVNDWKENTTRALGKPADEVMKDFFEYANFEPAIKKWTPELWEEVRGIAEGSGHTLEEILILNLLDEFWVYINNLHNHHCSGLGVPAQNGNPGYLSQNMDLENYTDGYQVLMRLMKTNNRPEQMVLTHPGLIALNGMNKQGVALCVNTLMQLTAAPEGLPVAFVMRRIINSTDKEDILKFIQEVDHASGQNYIIGIRGEVYDFEASATKVVRFNPENENGTVYHTNHPVVNDDVKPWFKEYDPTIEEGEKPTEFNSGFRFSAVEDRIATAENIDEEFIKEALRSKDNTENPVCRTNRMDGRGFTFASTIMTMADPPYLHLTVGPPDESYYTRFEFSTDMK